MGLGFHDDSNKMRWGEKESMCVVCDKSHIHGSGWIKSLRGGVSDHDSPFCTLDTGGCIKSLKGPRASFRAELTSGEEQVMHSTRVGYSAITWAQVFPSTGETQETRAAGHKGGVTEIQHSRGAQNRQGEKMGRKVKIILKKKGQIYWK